MMGKSYLELISKILAESGFAITIVGPDGPIVGTKAGMLVIDDLSALDRAGLKQATFGLNYHGDTPIEQVDFSALEQRILAAWDLLGLRDDSDYFLRNVRRSQQQRLRDFHVVQRKSTIRQKQWETKAAIKSRQLRNRQKGR